MGQIPVPAAFRLGDPESGRGGGLRGFRGPVRGADQRVHRSPNDKQERGAGEQREGVPDAVRRAEEPARDRERDRDESEDAEQEGDGRGRADRKELVAASLVARLHSSFFLLSQNGKKRVVFAKREVVLSAGTINTPQLLMLSGIGPKAHLRSVGVPVVLDLPGVGENLHNHQSFGLDFSLSEDFYPTFNQTNAELYLYNQTGPLSSTGLAQVTGVWHSNLTTPDDPDIQIFFAGYQAICEPRAKIADLSAGSKQAVRMSALNLQPTSKGWPNTPRPSPFLA